jgi:hypothetical protein
MGAIHLPAMAALPLLAGLLTGIYGAIAAMSVLPFTVDQMTLMAVFLLIAHSLIQEGLVQRQSGCPAWMATVVQAGGCCANRFRAWVGWWGRKRLRNLSGDPLASGPGCLFWPAMRGWAAAMAWLSLKILVHHHGPDGIHGNLEAVPPRIDKVVRIIEPFLGLLGSGSAGGRAVDDGGGVRYHLRRCGNRGRDPGAPSSSGSVENHCTSPSESITPWWKTRHCFCPWVFTPSGCGFPDWLPLWSSPRLTGCG